MHYMNVISYVLNDSMIPFHSVMLISLFTLSVTVPAVWHVYRDRSIGHMHVQCVLYFNCCIAAVRLTSGLLLQVARVLVLTTK